VWAPNNAGGVSEEIIVRWLKATGNRDRVLVATKVRGAMGQNFSEGDDHPLQREGLSRRWILRVCADSLRRLQVDSSIFTRRTSSILERRSEKLFLRSQIWSEKATCLIRLGQRTWSWRLRRSRKSQTLRIGRSPGRSVRRSEPVSLTKFQTSPQRFARPHRYAKRCGRGVAMRPGIFCPERLRDHQRNRSASSNDSSPFLKKKI
jgi:Aldo/keto reductase family